MKVIEKNCEENAPPINCLAAFQRPITTIITQLLCHYRYSSVALLQHVPFIFNINNSGISERSPHCSDYHMIQLNFVTLCAEGHVGLSQVNAIYLPPSLRVYNHRVYCLALD